MNVVEWRLILLKPLALRSAANDVRADKISASLARRLFHFFSNQTMNAYKNGPTMNENKLLDYAECERWRRPKE